MRSHKCPQVRCQPKYGVLVNDSFHREASSLIGILTFGRCTVSFGYNGGNRLPVDLHLSNVMLGHVFFLRTCKDGSAQEDCLLCLVSISGSLSIQLLQSSSVSTLHPCASVGP